MIIESLSDLHIDSTPAPPKESGKARRGMENYDYLPQPRGDADVFIIAGDIGPWEWDAEPYLERFAEEFTQGTEKPVIFVPGNHEFEGRVAINHRFPSPHPNVHILQGGDSLVVGDVAFIGATLWTGPDVGMSNKILAENYFDFSNVMASDASDFVSLEEWVRTHNAEKQAILEACQRHTAEGLMPIVITHFAPSPQSTPMQYMGQPYNKFYVTDLEKEILALEDAQPPLWIHGHVHHPFDYPIGRTRVICDPVGNRNDQRVSAWRQFEIRDGRIHT